MNIQEYIKSGIIESYVLGLADAEELESIEAMRNQYPEVEQAIRLFEKELEEAAMRDTLPVAGGLKSALFSTLHLETPHVGNRVSEISETAPLKRNRQNSFLKYLAAASVILLAGSAGLNICTYTRYRQLVMENQQLALQRQQLFVSNEAKQTRLTEFDKNLQQIISPDVIKVYLKGVPGKENNAAIVFWNKKNKEVYLTAGSLPKAPEGKQYQLWALLDGKPIDAGLLDECTSVCKLKNIQNAQAFAITLEKAGGSASPSLDQMYVMGNI